MQWRREGAEGANRSGRLSGWGDKMKVITAKRGNKGTSGILLLLDVAKLQSFSGADNPRYATGNAMRGKDEEMVHQCQ